MRRRVVLAIALVATASVALFAIPLGVALEHTYRDDENIRLQRDTVAATRQIDLGSGGDRIELPASHDRLGVYDRTGRLVAGSGPPRADAVVAATLRTGRPSGQDVSGRLLSAAPLLVRERVSGAVRAQRTDAAAAAR